MDKTIMISARDYLAVIQWEDEGGQPVEVVYDVRPDPVLVLQPTAAVQPTKSRDVVERRRSEPRTKSAA